VVIHHVEVGFFFTGVDMAVVAGQFEIKKTMNKIELAGKNTVNGVFLIRV
jgi:hypothetical protein